MWVIGIPMHDPGPFEAFARPLLQGANHVLGRGLEVHCIPVLWRENDLKQAGIACPLPLIGDGVERLLTPGIEPFMFKAAGLAGCALTLQVSSVGLPGSLYAGIRIPDIHDRPALKLGDRSPTASDGVSLTGSQTRGSADRARQLKQTTGTACAWARG
jgi:hypothetical protein